MRKQLRNEKIDETELKYGVEWVHGNKTLTGWIGNIKNHIAFDDSERELQVLLVFFVTQEGVWYKCQYEYNPYFFVEVQEDLIDDALIFLETKFEKNLHRIEIVMKQDLEQINHLSGSLKPYLKLSFRTVSDLVYVRNQIRNRVEKNQKREPSISGKMNSNKDLMRSLIDLREYDVPYHCRVCIDTGLRCGKWFKFLLSDRKLVKFEVDKSIITTPTLSFISFDIETSKLPLKFPDAKIDQIMMISLQYETKAILITNKQCVGTDVVGFPYAPKQEYAVTADIFNEEDEQSLMRRFFTVIQDYKPLVITSFNGDRFDWPFIEERCIYLGFSLEDELGIRKQEETGEYYGRYLCHMDCFNWVERDAFLPQGSHGLKAVTRAKLGYEPVEVDPEAMVVMAQRESQKMAEYSISDAVATYFLYKKHIHDFIFALCTIIPLSPDEVLRKGSGTLCECLLMAMAYEQNIIFPNKKKEQFEKFHQGHLLDSETYIGGKVECLRSGVYRSEFPQQFKMDLQCLEELLQGVPQLLEFMAKIEGKKFSFEELEKCTEQIQTMLKNLMDRGEDLREKPLIYHLDVAAMYPNIILTNRLQPVAIVDNKICSGCVFNSAENQCKRPLEWQWRGEHFPLSRQEFEEIKIRLEYQYSNPETGKVFKEFPTEEQHKLIKQRVKLYSQKTYKQIHNTVVELRKNTVCMRENDFYVSTVRDFRDRRYEFKELVKVWKGKFDESKRLDNKTGQKEAKDSIAFYDSQQLAHKIILNSFYGYVMRKGARWYSMEMAAMVTHIGSSIISSARQLIERIGLPLELDTDGIWCMLPTGFPEDFTMMDMDGKRVKFSYPCFILNQLVYEQYKNPQYQWLQDKQNLEYGIRTEMSIFFEVDGPYRCMMIPSAREENKQLKKRYVVYHNNGSIAELKGFEIKRRGELRLIKVFQEEIFKAFVKGNSLQECFEECGKVCKTVLNILLTQGQGLDDKQLIYYIGESRMLSKDLKEYGTQKGVAITAGKRMAEYLGEETVKGSGLNCSYIISKKPIGTPVTERAVPISVFDIDLDERAFYLRKWLKDQSLQDEELEMRNLLDWDYYFERVGNNIQKIVVIPALLQGAQNPVPEVQPPDWLLKRLREINSGLHQKKVDQYFKQLPQHRQQFSQIKHQIIDIEDMGKTIKTIKPTTPIKVKPIENDFNMDTQFTSWLSQQKKIWEQQIKKRKALTSTLKNLPPKKNNLVDHFHSLQKQMDQQVWQILQIHDIGNGFFTVWAILEGGQLVNANIKAQRKVYVHQHMQANNEYKRVKRTLPRDKPIEYLYEITMDEEEFQQEHGSFKDFLANPAIEGIYEYKVPLDINLIVELGTLWKIKNKEKKNEQLKDTDFKGVFELSSHKKYLQDVEDEMNTSHLMIEHIILDTNRQLITFFCPKYYEFTFIIVGQNKFREEFNLVAKQTLKKNLPNVSINDVKVRVIVVQNIQQGFLYIEQQWQQHKQQNSRIYQQLKLCIFRSSLKIDIIRQNGLKFICNDFPTLILPQDPQESQNPVGWVERTIKQAIDKYSNIDQILNQLLQLSRYASIPICNIVATISLQNYVTDILYARVLKLPQICNSILWWNQPEQEIRDLIPTDFTSAELHFPGVYLNYCVEISILQLPLNTIALSDELKNTDREITWLLANDNDELSTAKTAFKALKLLVRGWMEDVINFQDQVADLLIQNVCRWVYGGTSPLYDQYLGKMLTRLNKKVFHTFIGKLKQLGARIIYASLDKFIIATGKQKLEHAQSYTSYILEDIIQQPLFKYMSLRPSKYYSSLIYKDQFNYLGYTYLDNEEVIVQQLQMSHFLPELLKSVFLKILVHFLEESQKYRENDLEQIKELKTAQAVKTIQNLESKTLNIMAEYTRDKLSKILYDLVNQLKEEQKYQFKQDNMKKIMSDSKNKNQQMEEEEYATGDEYEQDSFVADDNEIEYKLDEEALPDQKDFEVNQEEKDQIDGQSNWEIPNKPGLRYEFNLNIVSHMVVMLSHMLSLDLTVEQEVRRIKTNCMKILEIGTCKETEFEDPCLVLLLQNMVCDQCFHVSIQVDLFRSDMKCQNCDFPYPTNYIEDRICDFLEQNFAFYYIQDLYCVKCKSVQENTLMERQIKKPLNFQYINRCPCSGQYQLRLDQFPNELMINFSKFKEALLKYSFENNMPFLREMLTQIV